MNLRQARLGGDIFTGAVVASVALALAGLSWRLAGYHGVGPAAAPIAPGGSALADIRPVLALAPFGAAIAATGEGGDGSIRLRAIFLAVPAEASIVLIAGADGKVVSYGIGQPVAGGVIEAIQAEQIVLRTANGQRIIGFNPEPQAGANALTGGGSAPSPTSAGAAAPALPASGIDAIRALIPREAQGRTTPSTATPVMPPPQVGAGPGATGYRVGSASAPAMLAAGIRPGDVIERVNGAAVGADADPREIMARAAAAGVARVEILRNGQRVSLSVPVR